MAVACHMPGLRVLDDGTELYIIVRIDRMFRFQPLFHINRLRVGWLVVSCALPNRSNVSIDKYSPFLAFVSSTREFDNQLNNYVNNDYVQTKYIHNVARRVPLLISLGTKIC